MSETLDVSFESPQSGWMSVRLRAGAGQWVAVVAHAPYDSLRDLLTALAALAGGRPAAVVRWNAEPDEFDFEFAARGDRARLRVVHFNDHRREQEGEQLAFSFDGARRELCLAFWRELRDLRERGETDDFRSNWRRAFPDKELRALAQALKKGEGGKRGKG